MDPILTKILKVESKMSERDLALGWSWHTVGMYPANINKLIVQGLVEISYSSRRYTHYRLTERGRTLAETGDSPSGPVKISSNMFNDIVGYDDIKELITESLRLDKPLHVLLAGPPALAKTLFLWDLERAGGDQAVWVVGSATSHAGLWDVVAEHRPRWVLVDELEKMSATDVSALLSLMEGGRLVRTKVGRTLDERVNTWVFAAANVLTSLSPELLSRFAVKQLKPYTLAKFEEVVTNVLVSREGTEEEIARTIAMSLGGKTEDVRDAVRVARLASRIGVKRAIELLFSS